MLFEIKEPTVEASTSVRHAGRGLGIDLGTTHSLVAAFDDASQAIRLIETEAGALMPSVVYYPASADPVVGNSALVFGRTQVAHTISSVKRLMGLGRQEIAGLELPYDLSQSTDAMIKITTPAGVKTPLEVSADILKGLMERVTFPVAGAVIGVPAYFDDAQRQATMDAAKLANIPVYRLINEPTAAALAYHLDEGEEGLFLVYDLGGGTFDVTLLSMQKGVFEVIATGGDTHLGGDDIDSLIAQHLMTLSSVTTLSSGAYKHLLLDVKVAKERLSTETTVNITWKTDAGDLHTNILTRTVFESLIAPLVAKTLAMSRALLKSAKVSASALKNVIFVGGATHSPYVRQAVTSALGSEGLSSLSPDTVVALGAAYLADKLAGHAHQDTLVLDVTPLSLGLEMMGGVNEKIIPRNTTLPASVTQTFTTYQDNQTGLSLHIVQGERELAADCRSLAKAVLSGIPPMPAGKAKIEVIFDVDLDGLLTVTARELTTQVTTHITVKPSYGLTDDEVTAMLMSSIENARDDMDARRLALLRVEATQLINVVQQVLNDEASTIDSLKQETIIEAISAVQAADQAGVLLALKQAMKYLESVVEPVFAKRLQAGLDLVLTGQTLKNVQPNELESLEPSCQ